MSLDLSKLNPMQRKAAETLDGPVLILAGAGSGKTRTLTYRVANLLAHGVKPYNILALTFTNKASREMRARIESLAGEDAGEMWLGTFHSVCVRILRRDIEKIGYQRSFTIYDDDDSQRIIKDALRILNIDDKMLPVREVRARISDAKNKLMSPDEWFASTSKSYREQQIHDIYLSYERSLKAANALDFDDLLLCALRLLVDHPPVLEYYQRKFLYVHVDEYQDTNLAQYSLVKLLTQESRNLCVVGDDDQSIYGWRGADIRNILDFEKDYPDAAVIRLEQNYRSTSNILDAANQVIAHNKGRKEKALWTDVGEGEMLKVCAAGDEREEAAWICERVRQMKKGGESYGNMAVLYRMHAQSRVLEEMFMRAGIPYRVFGGTRFYDRREIRDAIAYLRVIRNPADEVSLKRIINTPKRSIGDATIEQMEKTARERGDTLSSVLYHPPETLASRPRKCISDFAALIKELSEQAGAMPLSAFVQSMLDKSGLMAQYKLDATEEGRSRLENMMEFVGAAAEFERKSEDKSLDAFLENVALVSDLDDQEARPDYVTLMTLHSAKGLEYDDVFLAGLEEGIFPTTRAALADENVEEERRLCYVGLTRARRRLFLSRAFQRTLFNQITRNAPSRFLSEIPKRLMSDEWGDAQRRHFGDERPAPQPPKRSSDNHRSLSFGTPGMGLSSPASVPGVTKGITIPSQARTVSQPELFKTGDRVIHRKFGEGTVISLSGRGADARVTIAFTAYGEKEFALSIAPIAKLES